MADPRSGIREDGTWQPAFDGQREPLRPGHQVTVRHGGYGVFKVTARAEEIAASLEGVVPGYTPADDTAIKALAICMARCEAFLDAMAARKRPPRGRDRLDEELRRWLGQLARWTDALGLNPTSRAKMGADVARGAEALAYLRQRYLGGDGVPRVPDDNGAVSGDAAHAKDGDG